MKNLFSILILVLATVVTACYDDNGNYDYSELAQVDIKVSKDTIYVTQFTTLDLPANVEIKGGNASDYTYSWRVWSNEVGGVKKQKTISDDKNLLYEVTEVPGSYTLLLTCHNERTSVDTYKSVQMVVQGVITEGWMVLHEKDGKSDFDLIMTPFFSQRVEDDKVLHNVYESINGEPLDGKGVKIASFFTSLRYQNVVILTEKGGARLDATTMQKVYDMSTLMPDMYDWHPEGYIFWHYWFSPGRYGFDALVSNGHFYLYSCIGAMGFTTYVEPITTDGLTYRAAPYAPRYFDYFMALVYDELNGRFLYVSKNNSGSSNDWILREMYDSASGRVFDMKDMHASLRFMDTGFNNLDYGLFEDWTTHENYLCSFDFDNSRNNMDKAKYSAAECPDIHEARHFAVGDLGAVFYYATDRDIYLFDYNGTKTGKKLYTVQKSSEKITCMKLLKPCVSTGWNRFTSHAYNNKVLVIATYDESSGEGKVYMYYVNPGNGAIDISSEKIFGGFGEILDMDYNFPKYGS